MWPMSGISWNLTRAHFENSEVLNAVNPNPVTGYAHGPIPDNNPGWKPAAYTTAIANGAHGYKIRTADIKSSPPPNAPVILNKENIGVCDIAVNGPQMCGKTFSESTALWRHIREEHPGAIRVAAAGAKRNFEIIAGQNAIKRWILFHGWQQASYVHEPRQGPPGGWVEIWCDALERIAANDPQFAAQYGTRFHRFQTP